MTEQADPSIAIVGAGLQGARRAQAISSSGIGSIRYIISPAAAEADSLTTRFGGTAATDWRSAVRDPAVQIVIVCTPPDSHAEISIASLRAGKHVLCEKPLARTSRDAWEMARVAKETGKILHCGFNHRFHPAVVMLSQRLAAGDFGRPLAVRCAYGIGGRDHYEKEWRADPAIVSGGQLMEQGIHVVDLARAMLGEVVEATGAVSTSVFPIEPLEDNAMALFRHESGGITSIHSSLTQWANLFRYEVVCDAAVATVTGLGSSYGDETLEIWPRTAGRFAANTTHFRGWDTSWRAEWESFTREINGGMMCTHAVDGARAVELVEQVYAAAGSRTWIRVRDSDEPARDELLDAVLAVVRTRPASASAGPDDPLFTSGLLASVDLMEIVTRLDDELGFTVSPADLRTSNFDSAVAITTLLRQRRAGAGH